MVYIAVVDSASRKVGRGAGVCCAAILPVTEFAIETNLRILHIAIASRTGGTRAAAINIDKAVVIPSHEMGAGAGKVGGVRPSTQRAITINCSNLDIFIVRGTITTTEYVQVAVGSEATATIAGVGEIAAAIGPATEGTSGAVNRTGANGIIIARSVVAANAVEVVTIGNRTHTRASGVATRTRNES